MDPRPPLLIKEGPARLDTAKAAFRAAARCRTAWGDAKARGRAGVGEEVASHEAVG